MSRTTDRAIDELNERRCETMGHIADAMNPVLSDEEILAMIEVATREARGPVGFQRHSQARRVQWVRDLRPCRPGLRLEAHTFDDKARLRALRALERLGLAARIGCHSDPSATMPGRGYWLWARWDGDTDGHGPARTNTGVERPERADGMESLNRGPGGGYRTP